MIAKVTYGSERAARRSCNTSEGSQRAYPRVWARESGYSEAKQRHYKPASRPARGSVLFCVCRAASTQSRGAKERRRREWVSF